LNNEPLIIKVFSKTHAKKRSICKNALQILSKFPHKLRFENDLHFARQSELPLRRKSHPFENYEGKLKKADKVEDKLTVRIKQRFYL
jgi:hypothetical protein